MLLDPRFYGIVLCTGFFVSNATNAKCYVHQKIQSCTLRAWDVQQWLNNIIHYRIVYADMQLLLYPFLSPLAALTCRLPFPLPTEASFHFSNITVDRKSCWYIILHAGNSQSRSSIFTQHYLHLHLLTTILQEYSV